MLAGEVNNSIKLKKSHRWRS